MDAQSVTSWLERGRQSMNKSWLSGSANTELPNRKATLPSVRLLAWAWQPARGLWASGREAPPVRAQESSNENLLTVSHRNSVTAHLSRKPFALFPCEPLPTWLRSWKITVLADMMDGFGRWGEEGGDRPRKAVMMSAVPVHHCSFSQSGSHYLLAVAKMLLNGRVECEGESRSLWLSTQPHHTHGQPHFPLRYPSFPAGCLLLWATGGGL